MAVSSLKAGWYKFSSRIRDYIDVVDSYYRPPTIDPNTDTSSARLDAILNQIDSDTTHNNRNTRNSNHRHLSHFLHCQSNNDKTNTKDKRSHRHRHCHEHTLTSDTKPDFVSAANSQLPPSFSKRKTTLGQIYFVDGKGKRYWYDPSVPEELLAARFDLDSLVGRLSPSVWEVKQTSSGKTYYVNHFKRTTQFTDPRLVAHKDYLMSIYKYEQQRSTGSIQNCPSNNSTNSTNHPRQTQTERNNSLFALANTDSLKTHSKTSNSIRNCNAYSQHPPTDLPQQLNRQNTSNKSYHKSLRTNIGFLQNCTLLNNERNHYRRNLFSGSHQNLSSSTSVNRPKSPSRQAPRLTPLHKIRSHNESVTLENHQTNETNSNTSTLPMRSTANTTSINQGVDNLFSLNSANIITSSLSQQGVQECYVRKSKELSDKIYILRQELLKQQVIAHACRIDIHRKRIFEESFKVISQMHPKDLKKRLLVKFRGEEGLDYGGVAREWFHLLSREILNPVHGLFQYTSDDIYNLQINPDSGIVYREHLSYLNFCGRVIGMAVFHGHFIEGHFTLPFYKMLLRKNINLEDIENVDPELHRSLCWILENDVTNVIDTNFLVQHNAFGELQEHELKENGRNIAVTEENKHEYVSRYVNYRCRRGIENQFEALASGFNELISPALLEHFDEHELELLIGGLSTIDIDDWKLHTKLKNCNLETDLVKWFWQIVKSYSEDKRARLLQFVTGSPRVPIQGFKALQGFNSELRLFTIHLLKNASTDDLPKSHTCFNRIDIPPYESYEKLYDKLTTAIEETMGFAMQ